jgi:hypothetical protein
MVAAAQQTVVFMRFCALIADFIVQPAEKTQFIGK